MSTDSPIRIEDIKSPEDFLGLIENPALRDFVLLLVVANGLEDRHSFPPWAIRAMLGFLHGSLNIPRSKHQSPNYRFGCLFALLRAVPTDSFQSELRFLTLNNDRAMEKSLVQMMVDAPPGEASEFFDGYADGLRKGMNLEPDSPTWIYFVFALGWREVAELKNTSQIQTWLEKYLPPGLVGDRPRLTKLCRRMKFPLNDKGGRPKKTKPKPTEKFNS